MEDLKKIKKEYGEKMAQLCRELFPGFFETPGLMYELISSVYYPSRFLYDDVVTTNLRREIFINGILAEYKKRYKTDEEEETNVTKTPQELLEEAGYTLYECKTEADIQSFRHYYKRRNNKELPQYVEGTRPLPYDGEELCTFNGGRLERCHVFFAIKKNADELNRNDFNGKEEREDDYGRSVISIQFSRGSNNVLSIKNRYNHTVDNPDSTFGNNLDNIVPGLTQAFEETYGLKITHGADDRRMDLPGYVKADDGKYYKYNYEIGNVYYCPDNIIIDNFEVKHFDKSRYLVMDYFIIDFQEKKIFQYAPIYNFGVESSFDGFDRLMEDTEIESIRVETDPETKDKKITINDDMVITLYPTNEMKTFRSDKMTKVPDQFLIYIRNIQGIHLPNAYRIGTQALRDAKNLVVLDVPNCEEIEDYALSEDATLQILDMPKLEKIGSNVLRENKSLHTLNIPNCKEIGGYFLSNNEDLSEVDLPNCEEIGFGFLQNNLIIKRVNLPKCRRVDSDFLHYNTELEEIDMPNLEESGGGFLTCNVKIHKVNLPKLRVTYYNFMSKNKALESIELPSMVEVGPYFLQMNRILKHISLPNCAIVDDGFLCKNTMLEEIDLPEVVEIGDDFLESNVKLSRITIPKCKKIGDDFLRVNTNLEEIDSPEVQTINKCFLMWNEILKRITIPKCMSIGSDFLLSNTKLDEIDISSIEEFCDKLVTPDNPIEQGEYGFILY